MLKKGEFCLKGMWCTSKKTTATYSMEEILFCFQYIGFLFPFLKNSTLFSAEPKKKKIPGTVDDAKDAMWLPTLISTWPAHFQIFKGV